MHDIIGSKGKGACAFLASTNLLYYWGSYSIDVTVLRIAKIPMDILIQWFSVDFIFFHKLSNSNCMVAIAILLV